VSIFSKTGLRALTRHAFKILPEILYFGLIDVADIGHEIGYVALAVSHLLVHVVVGENLIDWTRQPKI
jgi:hypothetical protein